MTLDFGYDMFIDTIVDDTFPVFKGFARVLPNQPRLENDDGQYIETCLNNVYRGKDMKISYTRKEESELPIIQDMFIESPTDDIKQIILSLLEDIPF